MTLTGHWKTWIPWVRKELEAELSLKEL